MFHKTRSECSVDHARGLVFHRPQAASHRRAVVYFCSAVLKLYGDAGIAQMRQVKAALDPDWKLSPGVLFSQTPDVGTERTG